MEKHHSKIVLEQKYPNQPLKRLQVKIKILKEILQLDRWVISALCGFFQNCDEVFFRDPEANRGLIALALQKKTKRNVERKMRYKKSSGCPINWSEPKWSLAFHVTCGLNEELWIEYKEGRK